MFLKSDKKVLLIQGGGGSGKSLFCHVLINKILLKDEQQKYLNVIPLFINLPSLKDPINSVLVETLLAKDFKDVEI